MVDAGSVGVANVGVFKYHILPNSKTRVLVFLNVGSFAHTMHGTADVNRLEEVDPKLIGACVKANPGLIKGLKLRLVGPVVHEQGEEVIRRAFEAARVHGIRLMVHIGDARGDVQRMSNLTRLLLDSFEQGDILTHLCTPGPRGVMDPNDSARRSLPQVSEARACGRKPESLVSVSRPDPECAWDQDEFSYLVESLRTFSPGLLALDLAFERH